MPELVFIEGVSGVGKSTMVQMLSEELRLLGYSVREYVEFDYTNPLDFYCTAYLPLDKYKKLCATYKPFIDAIQTNTICAGNARLVRYYNGDIPLFDEPLLSELSLNEFCYNPRRLIPIKEYTSAYKEVWSNWASALDETYDFIIFDGSLLHHPINDMMRNYGIDGEQAISHITMLLGSLGRIRRRIFYIKTDNIGKQLAKAYIDRKQGTPTSEQIDFWENRYKNDMIVLHDSQEEYQIYDVSFENWNLVRKQILDNLTRNRKREFMEKETKMKIVPTLNFGGNCREAIHMYEKAFNGRISCLITYREANDPEYNPLLKENQKDYIYHSELVLGNQRIIMSDQVDIEFQTCYSNFLTIMYDTKEEVQRAYEIMKEGSKTIYQMEATPYSSCRVVFVDKFGIRWGIMTEQTEQ